MCGMLHKHSRLAPRPTDARRHPTRSSLPLHPTPGLLHTLAPASAAAPPPDEEQTLLEGLPQRALSQLVPPSAAGARPHAAALAQPPLPPHSALEPAKPSMGAGRGAAWAAPRTLQPHAFVGRLLQVHWGCSATWGHSLDAGLTQRARRMDERLCLSLALRLVQTPMQEQVRLPECEFSAVKRLMGGIKVRARAGLGLRAHTPRMAGVAARSLLPHQRGERRHPSHAAHVL